MKSARLIVRIAYTVLILCAVLLTATILFLSHINLDDYRQSLEEQLSTALKQPVTIGNGSLTFSHGLALELEQLQIGNGATPLVRIPRLLATLELKPLLDRRFILRQVNVEQPQLNLVYPLPQSRPGKGTSRKLFNSLGIETLTVQNGRLSLNQVQGNTSVTRAEIDNLHARLTGWQQDRSGRLVVSANLPRQQARVLLETKLPASVDPEVWRRNSHDFMLQVRSFSTADMPKIDEQDYPQALDLVITAQGTPSEGLRLKTHLTDAKTDENFLLLEGLWRSTAQQDSLTELSGTLLGIPLSGEFHYLRQADKNYLAGRFGAGNIQLNPQLLKLWRIPQADKLLQGSLDQLSLVIEKSWKPSKKLTTLPRIDSQVTITDLDWAIPELKQLQDLSVEFGLENNQLEIANGVIVVGGEPIEFNGRIDSLSLKPTIAMTLNSAPGLSLVQEHLKLPPKWKLSGDSQIKLQLTGPLLSPAYKASADLTATTVSHPLLFEKKSGQAARLDISGSVAAPKLEVNEAVISLGPNRLKATGEVKGGKQISSKLEIAPLQLAPLRDFSPLLERIKITGTADLKATLIGSDIKATANLKNAGAHITHVIADLTSTNGRAEIDNDGISFNQLKASLGESEFNVNGTLRNWKSPLLTLDIQADRVRAQDIIFPNRERTLRDLNGQLRIDGKGIYFAPVNVRLEDDTIATVTGSVTEFSDPQVELDIQAETVDVLDVIDLFRGPQQKKQSQGTKRDLKPILIKASAAKGTLGGLKFTNAEGLITEHKGIFSLYPLRFENGDGWCRARVDYLHNETTAPLRISGHVEGINASVLHQDLFEQPGLINGSLFGDFYLEGDPGGEGFWSNAQGGIHLKVKDGVFRKFHSLAKVFSLLNVSQLFAGKLPDMDKEGMPFSLMEGSIKVGQGLMSTEDLAITSESMNLSMVGHHNLVEDRVNFTLGVMPLRTVDKVITKIPIAGWILTGKNKALLTAYFKIKGPADKPQVSAIPVDSVSKTVFGIFKRTLKLPGKLVEDVGELLKQAPEKKNDTPFNDQADP